MSSLTVNSPLMQEAPLVGMFHAIIDGVNQLAINARDLHKFLNVGRRFATWIKERIEKYQFVENQDFILVSQNGEIKGRGGDRRSMEYHLSLDTAKELAMVENNEEGRKVRRYFINCEKMLRRSDSEQRTALRQACERLASGNMLVSDAYKYVGSHFGYPDGIVDIPVSLLPEAVVFTYEMILARQKPSNAMNDAALETNSHALSVHMNNCADWFDAVREPLSQLNPQLTSSISGQFYEGRSTARLVRRELISA